MVFNFYSFYYNIVLNKIVAALIILFVGMILGRVFGSLTKKILHEIDFNRLTSRLISLNSEKAISRAVSYLIYLATIISALNKLEITGYVWRGFLVFIAFIVASDLLLHLKDLLPNLYGYFKIKNIVSIGDTIESDLTLGEVKKITILSTKILDKEGDELLIPNSNLMNNFSIKKRPI